MLNRIRPNRSYYIQHFKVIYSGYLVLSLKNR
jgi:hypothetical protein